ncbi:hypothetical protein HRG_007273 [Hirsutella rhossiliensis]|uniref:Uncharacterized protein n=1 Tax=Hirsutella rhossiliensis TaxID=111463 RepID=A0A9P8MTX1_9HYPO|nr:uncharacterized protein HRG_07273 [Hirsutella rhossiliensis]KAH0961195.1 hypothetical protein HRG_07273 [Hirsutella rhossiliensis]
MATAAVQSAVHPAIIPGLGLPLEEQDLDLASRTYNALPPIEEQVKLQGSEHVKALLAIINIHDMGNFFGLHSLHRHNEVPEKTIRLEADVPGVPDMKWNRATPINEELLTEDRMHATFFKLEGDTLVAFEFAEGPSPLNGKKVPPQFIVDIVQYLIMHNLTKVIAIEVGDFSKARAMDTVPTGELEVIWGFTEEEFTVVIPLDRIVEGVVDPVLTGWNVKDGSQENMDSEPPAGQSWAKAVVGTRETHKVFVSKSHNAQAVTPELLKKALVETGLIKA